MANNVPSNAAWLFQFVHYALFYSGSWAVSSSNHHIGAARQHYLSVISIVVVYVV